MVILQTATLATLYVQVIQNYPSELPHYTMVSQ
jgi:hypothetical protein